MVLPFDALSIFNEGLTELELALKGEDRLKWRCPECEVRHAKEVREDVWKCPRCGIVDKPRRLADIECPLCGQYEVEVDWWDETFECQRCGVLDKDTLKSIDP